jgi:hypothetical protein
VTQSPTDSKGTLHMLVNTTRGAACCCEISREDSLILRLLLNLIVGDEKVRQATTTGKDHRVITAGTTRSVVDADRCLPCEESHRA